MSGGGGSEPNLTPFIDLFSVLICFLLMTAAWIQLEAMPMGIDKNSMQSSAPPPDNPPPPPPDEKKINLAVSIAPTKIVLKENEVETVVTKNDSAYDKDQVRKILSDWRSRYPEKKDLVLNSEADVLYGELIDIYDLLIASDWAEVGINPN